MSERINPTTLVQPGHHINLGQQLRDTSELENLQPDVQEIKRPTGNESITMPWRIGRPLRSTGQIETTGPDAGYPRTPLAVLDLSAVVPASQQRQLVNELDRARINDAISEGVLDQAEREHQPLMEEEQWWEAEASASTADDPPQHKRGPFADGSDPQQQ